MCTNSSTSKHLIVEMKVPSYGAFANTLQKERWEYFLTVQEFNSFQ